MKARFHTIYDMCSDPSGIAELELEGYMRGRPRFALLVVLLAFALVASACSGDDADDTTTTAGSVTASDEGRGSASPVTVRCA